MDAVASAGAGARGKKERRTNFVTCFFRAGDG